MKIRKAVIPVAGKGTRFLPATKELPKEMIPILNRPMISLVVDEAIAAGIEEIIFITSRGKGLIENYFDRNQELEQFLLNVDKNDQASVIKNIGTKIEIVTVRQKEQLGLGHAINCAKSLVGDEPFAVLLGDDVLVGEVPGIGQLIASLEESGGEGIVGLFEVEMSETNKYGVISGKEKSNGLYQLEGMVEKPEPNLAPTNLAVPGRYVFTPKIFEYLDKIQKGVGGEYQLTDAIQAMAKENTVYGKKLMSKRYDTGSLEGYLEATIAFAMNDKKLRDVVIKVVKEHE